ncbi:MAG: N-acetyltransferase [Cryobacterium sp.]|nr:N-acetyltransferase [Oligoflexia bacterium]
MKIRAASESDRERIFQIRNEIIRTSDAILEDEPWTLSKWNHYWEKRETGLPFLVLVREVETDSSVNSSVEEVMGYAVIAYFMDRSGYRVTGEISIHLDASVRGLGQGSILLQKIIEAGRSFGFHSLISRITGTNSASVRMHEKQGFIQVGHLPRVARKFGNFVDVFFYQKRWE